MSRLLIYFFGKMNTYFFIAPTALILDFQQFYFIPSINWMMPKMMY